jgi:hypothetical protein
MPKILLLASISALAALLFTSCGGGNFPGELNQSIELRPGNSVYIKSDDLMITFLEISQDSRCPTGAT